MAVFSNLFLQHNVPHAFGAAGDLPPEKIHHIKQIHSALTHCVDGVILADLAGDGVYSYTKKICAVKTADCVPLLVASQNTNFYAAIHAGWRGIVSEIIPNFLQKFSETEKKTFIFAIGPCICDKHFEVGPEVVAEFLQKSYFAANSALWLKHGTLDRSFINLKAAASIQLQNCGIDKKAIDCVSDCTFADKKFHSYRRDKLHSQGKVPSNWSWVGKISSAQ